MIFRAVSKQCIERSEKRRQCFARSSRGGNQRMPAGLNGRPATHLWFGRRTECLLEPPGDRGMKFKGLHGTKNGKSKLDLHARKKRTLKRWIGFSEDDVDCRRPIISFLAARRKSGGKATLTNALRTTRSTRHHELARSMITSRNMRRLSRKKLTLLPSAWFQRTGTSRIRRPARCAR